MPKFCPDKNGGVWGSHWHIYRNYPSSASVQAADRLSKVIDSHQRMISSCRENGETPLVQRPYLSVV